MYTPVNISEESILRYGQKRLSVWAFVRSRCPNGVVYMGHDQQREDKLGWRRSMFFSRMALLVQAGLARKDEYGNWRLKPVDELTPERHKCTIMVRDGADEYEVRDLLSMKLMEMGHRQVVFGMKMEAGRKSSRAEVLNEIDRKKYAKTIITHSTFCDVGSDRDNFVKLAAEVGDAQMNTDKLMCVTNLGRSSLFAFKKRAKARGWFTQTNHDSYLPKDYYHFVEEFGRTIEKHRLGKIFVSGSDGRFIFRQASTYSLNHCLSKQS